jgi:hypothetical protein
MDPTRAKKKAVIRAAVLASARGICMLIVLALLGALAGAVGLSGLTALLSAAFETESFGDTQFVMGFALTVPVGMMLGSVTSVAVHQSRRSHWRRAGWIAAVGGAAIMALATSVAWGSAFSGDGGWAEFVGMLLSLWIAPRGLVAALS